MLDYISLCITEDMTGANGDLDRSECIRRAAEQLADFVHEGLLERGIGGSGMDCPHNIKIPFEAYRAIQSIVAAAMVAQFERDEGAWHSYVTETFGLGSGAEEAP